ncbi:MAG: radical SAM protein, partial [Candidatus Eisenbacteria sp.]|nr:radical SAM protein [Candidatus Eisenbacteria bacterium]
MAGPVGCVVAITYRCNARCTVCDIWKRKSRVDEELAPPDYAWLPGSLRSVNVSGGEPFLRDDLVEIVSVIERACPRARVVISTNGLSPSRIERTMAQMSHIAVRVSIDAVGEKHDEIRGVEGGYEKAVDTVRRLKVLGVSDLGLAATSSEKNPGELLRVENLADELGVSFVASAAHSSPIFFGAHDEDRPTSEEAVGEIAEIMRHELASRNPRNWARAYYMRGLIDYVRGKPRRLPCGAGVDHFYLDPFGDVYPCNISSVRMGDIRDGSFEQIRRSSVGEVVPAVAGCEEQCWMVCTVSP